MEGDSRDACGAEEEENGRYRSRSDIPTRSESGSRVDGLTAREQRGVHRADGADSCKQHCTARRCGISGCSAAHCLGTTRRWAHPG